MIVMFIYKTILNIINAKSKTNGRPRSETGNRERQAETNRVIDRKCKEGIAGIRRRIRTCKGRILCRHLGKEDSKEQRTVIIMLKDRLSIIPLFIFYLDILDTYPAYALFCMSQLIQTNLFNRNSA